MNCDIPTGSSKSRVDDRQETGKCRKIGLRRITRQGRCEGKENEINSYGNAGTGRNKGPALLWVITPYVYPNEPARTSASDPLLLSVTTCHAEGEIAMFGYNKEPGVWVITVDEEAKPWET